MSATTKKYLDYDGLVQYTGKVKKAVNDASYTHGVTDIEGTPSSSAPTIAGTVNATNNARSGNFTVNGSTDTFTYYDTTYSAATTSKDGLMSSSDKTKLNGIATGAEVNVQSDWNQTTTTEDDYIKNKPAVNKVKQTEKTNNASYQMLMTDISTSATDDEVEYTTQVTHNPNTRVTSFVTTVGNNSVNVKIESGGVTFGSSSDYINASNYTGTAAKATADAGGNTISTTYAKLSDLSETEATVGAALIGYAEGDNGDITVADALDDIYNTLGGSGGSSVMDLIEDLQEGDNIVAGSNITKTADTTNHTVTIAAADEKVAQTEDVATSGYIPVLLASGVSPTSPAGTKYNSNMKYSPISRHLQITEPAYAQTPESRISINGSGITFSQGSGTSAVSVSLTKDNYGGTAAKATADGSGNNIVNTYATKAALDALSNKWTGQFKIATSAEATAIAGGDASGIELGYIYLVADSNASSPNVYDEYIKVALGTTPETYSVEKIGTTDAGVDVVSLTTSEINTIWSTTAAAS